MTFFCSLYFKHKYLISLHQVLMMLDSVLSNLIMDRGNFALFVVHIYDIAPLLKTEIWRCKHNLLCIYDHFILNLWKLRPPSGSQPSRYCLNLKSSSEALGLLSSLAKVRGCLYFSVSRPQVVFLH